MGVDSGPPLTLEVIMAVKTIVKFLMKSGSQDCMINFLGMLHVSHSPQSFTYTPIFQDVEMMRLQEEAKP